MRFEFAHTHIYPGGKARLSDGGEDAAIADCVVEFSDGVVVAGRYARAGETIRLQVPAYRTARGARIVAKQWLLQADGMAGRWRVRKRLDAGAGPEERVGAGGFGFISRALRGSRPGSR